MGIIKLIVIISLKIDYDSLTKITSHYVEENILISIF